MTGKITSDMVTEQSDALKAFSRALGREVHVLRHQPDLCWQQLHNRLQWENGSAITILEAEKVRRILPDSKPWLRMRNAFPEAKTLAKVLSGHSDRVSACAFSADGTWLASASQDGTLKIWDSDTGLERCTLKGHEAGVNACAISRDGTFIVSASKDESLKVWDTAAGALLATLQAHNGPVMDCKISPDGNRIVSAGWDGVLRLWDRQTGTQIGLLPDNGGASGRGPYACSISPDGNLVAAVFAGSLCIWDVASGKMHKQLETRFAQEGGPFDFAPNGKLIACANRDATVSLWDLSSDPGHIHLQGHRDDELTGPVIGENYYITDPSISRCKFSPDGSLLATGSNLGIVRIWDVGTGNQNAHLAIHSQPITDLAFSPDGKILISASEDHTIKLIDPVSGQELGVLEGHGGEVTRSVSSPDGTMILSASDDSTLRLWIMPVEGEAAAVPKHTNLVSACAISPDSSFAVSAGMDGVLAIWDLDTGMARAACLGHLGPVGDCAISLDGRFLISWGDDLTMRFWESDTGQELAVLREADLYSIPGMSMQPGTARKCVISPDGSYAITIWMNLTVWDLRSGKKRISLNRTAAGIGETCVIAPDASFFAAGNSSSIAIYDAQSGLLRRVLEGKAPLALSPDGRLIVSCAVDTRALIISEVNTGSQRAELVGHTAKIRTCAFSHDGSFIVSGAEDGSVKIWDASLGILLSETTGHEGIVWQCAITPDDGVVVTIGSDQMLYLWDPHTGAAVCSFPLSAKGTCFALDKARPTAIVGDLGGSVYLLDIISPNRMVPTSEVHSGNALNYKQITITAEIRKGNKLSVCCPMCRHEVQITEQQLGQAVRCGTPGCSMQLRVNRFVVGERKRSIWG